VLVTTFDAPYSFGVILLGWVLYFVIGSRMDVLLRNTFELGRARGRFEQLPGGGDR
jgi:hypothetical protein